MSNIHVFKIEVRVRANAKHARLLVLDPLTIQLDVKSPAQDGRANIEVIQVLAKHFSRPKSAIKILHGLKNSTKLVEVDMGS